MAIQTKHVVDFDGGACFWEYDFEDGATGAIRRITQIRCTNNGTFNTRGTVTVQSNGRTFSQLVQPGNEFSQNVPGSAQARLDITIDARGRVNGIDHSFSYGSEVI